MLVRIAIKKDPEQSDISLHWLFEAYLAGS